MTKTIWLTGLSASGKSTLAYALHSELLSKGRPSIVLDGDHMRRGLSNDLGFGEADRTENIRRVAEVARLMNDAGLFAITALISPFTADRALAKSIIGGDRFIEVYVSTPIQVCEARDPKGLYKEARAATRSCFTGVSQRYEVPLVPDMTIDTSCVGTDISVNLLMSRFIIEI